MKFICLLILVFLSFQMGVAQSIVEIEKLENKAVSFNRKNNDSLLFYAEKILDNSISMKYEKGMASGYLLLSLGNYYNGQNQKAENLAKKAIQYYKNVVNSEEGRADCYKIIGDVALYNQDFEKAYSNLMNAKILYSRVTAIKRKDKEFLILNDFALLYILIDDYDKALVILNDVQSRGRNFDNVLADSYELFSIISNAQGDYEESDVYFKKAKVLREKINDTIGIITIDINLAINQYYLKEYSKAIVNLNKTLIVCQQTNNRIGIFKSNLYLSKSHIEKNELDQARYFLNEAEKVANANAFPIEEVVYTRASLLIKKQDYDEAILLTNNFLKENKTVSLFSEIDFYKLLKESFKRKGDYKKELLSQEEITSLEAKMNSKNQANRIATLQAEFKYKNLENELKLKNKELELIKVKEKNTYNIISFLVSLGVLIILFFLTLFSRQKRINLMNKKVLQAENQILESKRKQTALEIEFKNKEITDFAIHISEKNEILEDIKNKIKELRLKDFETQNKATDLVFFINNNITQNREKVDLYSDIQETTSSFFQKLEFIFPELTEKEKRVASLVMLQLSSKQIAQQLTIAPKSIDNYRTTLRKKMNVPKEQSLSEFLKNLS